MITFRKRAAAPAQPAAGKATFFLDSTGKPRYIDGDTGAVADFTGPQGIQGVKGDKGNTGDQGIQGVKGDQGIQGIQGVKGDTGTAGTNGTNGTNGANATLQAATRSAASASFSTAVTPVQTYTPGAGEIIAGSEYDFKAVLMVTQTAAAVNLVITLMVGATTVLTLTQALGATARTSQPVVVEGKITFYSATQAVAYIWGMASSAVAFSAVVATAPAGVTTPAQPSNIILNVSTSATTATVVATAATVTKVK